MTIVGSSKGEDFMRRVIVVFVVAVVFCLCCQTHVQAAESLGTGFTYQGRYEEGGDPFNGTANFRFTLWDSEMDGVQIGNPQILTDVPVTDGLFGVVLNSGQEFGMAAFVGEARWLQIEVCANSECTVAEVLVPRQSIQATPYSHFATTAISAYWPNLIDMPEGFADGFDNAGDSYWVNDGGNISYIGGLVGIGTTQPHAISRLNVVNVAASQWAIRGDAASGGIGVAGLSPGGTNARGVYGTVGPEGYCGTSGDHSGSGNYGLLGTASEGVFANSPSGNGVRGVANTGIGLWGSSDTNVGVYGASNSSNGVSGGSGSASGVYGVSSTGYGVFGTSPTNAGVRGESNSDVGVSGTSSSYIGVEGNSVSSYGVFGYSDSGFGVYGRTGASGEFAGVLAEGSGSSSALRVNGQSYLNGVMFVTGNASVLGHLTVDGDILNAKSTVLIDHPLDPENKYLSHSAVESSEMKNLYDGVVETDDEGRATVVLPDWFDSMNKDFRYQLTVIDPADNDRFVRAKVVKEIEGNRFAIRTSEPKVRVSWMVTGVRNDAYAKANPAEVEKLKPLSERGKYLDPEAYGQPKEKGIHYRPELELASRKVPVNDTAEIAK